MRMVMVIYRYSLDQEIRHALTSLGINAFTEVPKIVGVGDAGQAFGSLTWPGHHAILLSALENEQAEQVIGVLKEFRDHKVGLQGGGKIPMRVFLLPCQQVI